MSKDTLIEKIDHLPSILSKDLNDYLSLLNARDIVDKLTLNLHTKSKLIEEKDINIYEANYIDKKPKLKRGFGGLKGFVTYMADDFDAPLDDFKDYM